MKIATLRLTEPHERERPLTIVYVGTLEPYGTCFHRAQALARLRHLLIPVPTASWAAGVISVSRRAASRLLGPLDWAGANRRLLACVRDYHPDVVWVDKGLTIDANTLAEVRRHSPSALLVHYSPDDMLNPRNQSRRYLECVPAYDLHVTTKSYNVEELKGLGARRVLFVTKSYCPVIHRPVQIRAGDRERLGGAVGFIGALEPARYKSILALNASGIAVRTWGEWRIPSTPLLRVENRLLYNMDYARAICAFDINLCFLRKENRDRQTSRSVEIPACRGFMLAERTDEHLALFEEDREAAYFGSDDELVHKVRMYLADENKRQEIAQAGYRRCIAGRYSNDEMIAGVLTHLFEPRGRE